MSSPMTRRRVKASLITAATFAIVLAAVFPVYWMVVSALQSGTRFQSPSLWPTEISFDAITAAFDKRPVGRWFINTSVVSLVTALITAVLASNAGYALARFKSWLTGGFGIIILFTQMLPAALLVVPIYVILRRLNLLDELAGLIVANTAFALPLGIWLMRGFVKSVPTDLEEQAQVDGCSRFGAYMRITVPLLVPGIVVVVVFSFLLAWNDFFFARSLIFTADRWVLSVGLTSFESEYTIEWSELMGAAVAFTVPAVIFFGLVQQRLVSGLTAGSVKG
ncbi:MAG: carbohydrate ABC transporter permease [Haloechinothrix sp.]